VNLFFFALPLAMFADAFLLTLSFFSSLAEFVSTNFPSLEEAFRILSSVVSPLMHYRDEPFDRPSGTSHAMRVALDMQVAWK